MTQPVRVSAAERTAGRVTVPRNGRAARGGAPQTPSRGGAIFASLLSLVAIGGAALVGYEGYRLIHAFEPRFESVNARLAEVEEELALSDQSQQKVLAKLVDTTNKMIELTEAHATELSKLRGELTRTALSLKGQNDGLSRLSDDIDKLGGKVIEASSAAVSLRNQLSLLAAKQNAITRELATVQEIEAQVQAARDAADALADQVRGFNAFRSQILTRVTSQGTTLSLMGQRLEELETSAESEPSVQSDAPETSFAAERGDVAKR